MNLIVAETSARCQTLVAAARIRHPDVEWRGIALGDCTVELDKRKPLDDEGRPRFCFRGRRDLNRVITAAVECPIVWLATEPGERGEHLAVRLRGEIWERVPGRTVHRIEATNPRIFPDPRPLDLLLVDQQVARVGVDHAYWAVGEGLGMKAGRAIIPALRRLADLSHDLTLMRTEAGEFMALGHHDPGVQKFRPEIRGREVSEGPPPAHDIVSLIASIDWKATETSVVTRQLHDVGYITHPSASSEIDGRALIRSILGTGFVGSTAHGIAPTDFSVTPSDVPTPVRPIYRQLWARGLAACSVPAKVVSRTASVTLGDARYRMLHDLWEVLDPGYLRVAVGVLGRAGTVPDVLEVQGVERLTGVRQNAAVYGLIDFRDPAAVLRSLEGAGYIEYRGLYVVVTDLGRELLRATRDIGALHDLEFFCTTEHNISAVGRRCWGYGECVRAHEDYVQHIMMFVPPAA